MAQVDLQMAGLFVAGMLLLLWFGKRRFNQTSRRGRERFSSYGHKIRSGLLDAVLLGGGFGSLGAAALLFVMEYAAGWAALAVFVALGLLIERDMLKWRR